MLKRIARAALAFAVLAALLSAGARAAEGEGDLESRIEALEKRLKVKWR